MWKLFPRVNTSAVSSTSFHAELSMERLAEGQFHRCAACDWVHFFKLGSTSSPRSGVFQIPPARVPFR